MKTRSLFTLSLLSVALLQACGGLPANNSQLDAATRNLQSAQSSPSVTALAPGELKDAEMALAAAQAAWTNRGTIPEVDHLAYLAKQKTAIAEETARQRTDEKAVTEAQARRNQILLAARTQEAESALRSADSATQRAQLAQQQSAQSRLEAGLAMQSAANSQMQADEARNYAAQLQQRLDALDAKQTERGLVVTIGDILFDTASATLKTGTGNSVDRLGDFLLAYPQRNALIEGYTDSVGSTQSNQDLSERRAGAVRGALLRMGVRDSRLAAQGYGEGYPVGSNLNAEGRMANRRVEVILSDEAGKVMAR